MKPRCLSIPEVILFVPMVFRTDQRILSENAGQHVFEELETGAFQCDQENHSGSSRTVSNSLRNKVDNSNRALARVACANADALCISSPLSETFTSFLLRGNNHIQQRALQGLNNVLFAVSALAECTKKSFRYNSEIDPFFKWLYSDLPINWRFNEVMAVRSTLSAKKLSIPTFEDAEKPS